MVKLHLSGAQAGLSVIKLAQEIGVSLYSIRVDDFEIRVALGRTMPKVSMLKTNSALRNNIKQYQFDKCSSLLIFHVDKFHGEAVFSKECYWQVCPLVLKADTIPIVV